MKTLSVILVLSFLLSTSLIASDQNNKIDDSNIKILIIPFNALGVDSISLTLLKIFSNLILRNIVTGILK